MRRAVAVAAVLALLAATGCTNRESAQARAPRDTGTRTALVAADGVQEMTVSGSEQLRFTPSTVKARAGVLRIIVKNTGTTPHDLKLGDQSTGLIRRGEQATITVTLTPGRYPFECTLHIRVHMSGTVVVS